MNTQRLKSSVSVFAVLAALAMGASSTFAVVTNVLIHPIADQVMTDTTGNQGSSAGGGHRWQNWWVNGDVTWSLLYDTTNPPPTGSSGSMFQAVSWVVGVDNNNRGVYTVAMPGNDFWGSSFFNGGDYQSLELDFKYDTNSTLSQASAAGVSIGLDAHTPGGVQLLNLVNTGATATNFDGSWHHLSLPIPTSISGVSAAYGVGLNLFQPFALSGSANFWVANLDLIGRSTPPPLPSMTLDRTQPGLRQFADAVPNYNRQSLRTDTTPPGSKNIDWVGHPGATYSWTFSEFATAQNFNAGFTLTSDPAPTMTYSDPDWSSSNVLWINIVSQANGSATAVVRCKTNQPSGNSQIFGGTGMLGGNSLNVPSAVGTWSVTFNDNTHLTLTAPNGASTNVVLDAGFGDVSSYTNISCALYTGMSSDANAGKFATLTHFGITGVGNPVNEDLTDGALNTPFLALDSQGYGGLSNPNPPNQVFITTDDAYWLHWTLPDTGFGLVAKTNLTDPYWLNYAPANILLAGPARWVKIPKAGLPSTHSFFAVLKRPFTGLQVLLPGETNAPNTLTGKTGTPDPVALSGGGLENVTINAVDSTFNIVNVSGDVIQLSSTDPSAIMPLNGPLANGTRSTQVQFVTEGTWTITATNLTSTNNLTGTSSSVTVTQ